MNVKLTGMFISDPLSYTFLILIFIYLKLNCFISFFFCPRLTHNKTL